MFSKKLDYSIKKNDGNLHSDYLLDAETSY